MHILSSNMTLLLFRRDLTVAAVLVLIVIVFFICHSVKGVINMVELSAVTQDMSLEELAGYKINMVSVREREREREPFRKDKKC